MSILRLVAGAAAGVAAGYAAYKLAEKVNLFGWFQFEASLPLCLKRLRDGSWIGEDERLVPTIEKNVLCGEDACFSKTEGDPIVFVKTAVIGRADVEAVLIAIPVRGMNREDPGHSAAVAVAAIEAFIGLCGYALSEEHMSQLRTNILAATKKYFG